MQTIENPWRKAFEATAALAWGATAIVGGMFLAVSTLPAGPIWLAIAVALAMAAWRGYQTFYLWFQQAQLVGRPIKWMEASEIAERVDTDSGKLFLGFGFDWERRHVQRLNDLKKLDLKAILPPAWFMRLREHLGGESGTNLRGAEWIHGLEVKEKELQMPWADLAGNTLLFGTTRAGKSRTLELIIAHAIHRPKTCTIILDPKGDRGLRERAQLECERTGRPESFMHFHPAFPWSSVRLDPLKNWTRPTELSNRVASLIPSEAGDSVFKTFAWRAINQIVGGLLETEQRPNLVTLRRYIEGGPDHLLQQTLEAYFNRNIPDWQIRLEPYLKRAQKGEFAKEAPTKATPSNVMALVRFYKHEVPIAQRSEAVDGLMSMFEHDRDHQMRLIASLLPILTMLTSGDLGALLSPDPRDTSDPRPIMDTMKVIRGGQVVYIGLDSLSDSAVGTAIGSIFLADLAAVAGHVYNYGDSEMEVNVFVDEAAELVNAPFVQMLNKAGGANFKTFFCAQTLPDFIARTGNEAMARQILGNANNLIAFRTKDRVTQDFIVETLGEVPVHSITRTQATNAMVEGDPTHFSGGYGERLESTSVEVFPADLLGKLPDLQYIASVSGGRVIKGRIPLLKKERAPLLEEMPWMGGQETTVRAASGF